MGENSLSTKEQTVLLCAQTTGGGSVCNFEKPKSRSKNENARGTSAGSLLGIAEVRSATFHLISASAEMYGRRGSFKIGNCEFRGGFLKKYSASGNPLSSRSIQYGEKPHLITRCGDVSGHRANPYKRASELSAIS